MIKLTDKERDLIAQEQCEAARLFDIKKLENTFAKVGGYRAFWRDAWSHLDYEGFNEDNIYFYHFLTTLSNYETFATQSWNHSRAECRLLQVIFKNEALRDKVLSEPELKTIFDKAIDMNLHVGSIIAPNVLDSLYKQGAIRYDKSFLQAVLQTDEKSQEILKRGGSPFINASGYLDYALTHHVDMSVIKKEEWLDFLDRKSNYIPTVILEKLYEYQPEIKSRTLSGISKNIHYNMSKMLIDKVDYLLDNHEHTVDDLVSVCSYWADDMNASRKQRFLALVNRIYTSHPDEIITFVNKLKNYLPAEQKGVPNEFHKTLNSITLYEKLNEQIAQGDDPLTQAKGFKI